jgi:hypothetical protein
MSVNILSISGGGVRAYMSSKILAAIESQMSRPLREVFTYFSGVSAGAIVSMGLLKGYSALETSRMFRELAPKIFYAPISYRLSSGGGLFNSIYPEIYIETELEKIFGNWRCQDVQKDFMITSYDMNQDMPLYFSQKTNLYVKDIIRCSTSAPVYFPPKSLIIDGIPILAIDGGVISNNPSEIALVTALSKYGSSNKFNLLSIGTGIYQRSNPLAKPPTGLISWSTNLLDTIFSAGNINASNEIRLLKNSLLSMVNGVSKFDHIEWNLDEQIKLDDTSSFDTMDRIVDSWISQNQQVISDIAKYYSNM